MKGNNYIECANKNESIFRLILDELNVPHQGMTIEEIYKQYSEGRRNGIWTILGFKEVEPNIFEFSSEDVAVMSGGGSSDKYTVENGKLKRVGNIMSWMS